MSWQAQNRDALQKFMRESILQLCRINLCVPGSYEVDGIICITRCGSSNVERNAEEDQIVVKVHEQITSNARENTHTARSNASILRRYLSSQSIPSRPVQKPPGNQPPLNLKRKANDENDNAVIDVVGNDCDSSVINGAKLLRYDGGELLCGDDGESNQSELKKSSDGKAIGISATNAGTNNGSLELFSCGSCLLDFGSLVSLKGHFQVSHSSGLEHYCRTCSIGFLHSTDLEKHNSATHPEKLVPSVSGSRRKQNKPRRGFTHDELSVMGNGLEDEDTWNSTNQSGSVSQEITPSSSLLQQTPITKMLDEDKFSDTARRETDYELNSAGSDHVCPHCTSSFGDFSTFSVHCQAVHHRYPCPRCLQTFTQRVNRDRHVHNHTGHRPHECSRCGDSFTRRDALRKHQLKCSSSKSENAGGDPEVYRTVPFSDDDSQPDIHGNSDCGLDLSLSTLDHSRSPRPELNELRKALDQENIPIVVSRPASIVQSFMPPRTSDAVAGRSVVKNELPDFNKPVEIPPLEAAEPRPTFPPTSLLTEGRLYSCDVCRAAVVSAAAFEVHCRSEHRRTPCIYCGKTFSQKGNMERHQRQHTGERPFACPHCSCSYTRKETLKVHINQAHPDAVAAAKTESLSLPASSADAAD